MQGLYPLLVVCARVCKWCMAAHRHGRMLAGVRACVRARVYVYVYVYVYACLQTD